MMSLFSHGVIEDPLDESELEQLLDDAVNDCSSVDEDDDNDHVMEVTEQDDDSCEPEFKKRLLAVTQENNQDELIMAQERLIEKEIADCTPLIGKKEDIITLQKEYAADDLVYLQKVRDLQLKYMSIRRTRGDGNCFFRAFAFAYLEYLLENADEYNRFKEMAVNFKDDLVSLGFPQFTIEDFHETFIEVTQKIGTPLTIDELLAIINDQNISDYLVVYLRLITSGYLQKNKEFFSNFVEGGRSIKEFCNQEVEPMYKESDHIHIIALSSALKVGIRIQYMDRGDGGKVNAHDFPDSLAPKVHLLYRPGHYDILYGQIAG